MMPSARSVLDRLRLSAKKRFGQNFLNDADDLDFIADALGLRENETVLEIGPGLGALTEALLKKKLHVAAVEKDLSMVRHLQQQFQGLTLRVFPGDILKFNLRDLSPEEPNAAVGNIPYNITSPILFWLVEHRAVLRRAVLTVQWEVAQRLAGKPGHEGWGALSVSLQAYAEVRLLRRIPKSHFYPAPKVDSAVVRLDFLPKPRFEEAHRGIFHEIVARAFQKRRKMLLNALENERAGHDKQALSDAFECASIDPKRRPETLSVSEWVSLAACLSK